MGLELVDFFFEILALKVETSLKPGVSTLSANISKKKSTNSKPIDYIAQKVVEGG